MIAIKPSYKLTNNPTFSPFQYYVFREDGSATYMVMNKPPDKMTYFLLQTYKSPATFSITNGRLTMDDPGWLHPQNALCYYLLRDNKDKYGGQVGSKGDIVLENYSADGKPAIQRVFRKITGDEPTASSTPKTSSSASSAQVFNIIANNNKNIEFQLPSEWIGKYQTRDRYAFETKRHPVRLIGYICGFLAPPQSAFEWAVDEANALSAKGVKITMKAREIQLNSGKWTNIGWENSMQLQGRSVPFQGLQYYLNFKKTMIEVFISGPKESFNENTVQEEAKKLLSSVQFK